jgi:hypothetical protein
VVAVTGIVEHDLVAVDVHDPRRPAALLQAVVGEEARERLRVGAVGIGGGGTGRT